MPQAVNHSAYGDSCYNKRDLVHAWKEGVAWLPDRPGRRFIMDYIWSPWRMEYIISHKNEADCIFCQALAQPDSPENLIFFRGERAFVIVNRYPYTSGHLMVVPYEHQPSLEGLEPDIRAEMMELTARSLQVLSQVYQPQGFNIGVNIGAAAGAGILDHVHMHVVPRWKGDTNFMSTLGETRVLPEALEDTYQRVRSAWESNHNP